MLRLEGAVEIIKREKHIPPDDGIHKVGKEGNIKGVHSVKFNGMIIPKGSVGFYHPIPGVPDMGVKVYIGGFPDRPWVSKKTVVQNAYKNLVYLSMNKLGPSPGHVIPVKVKWMYKDKIRSIKAYGLTSVRCEYPEKAWADYAKGRPYDFGCLDPEDHPEHSIEGLKRFYEKLRVFCKNNRIKFSAFDWKKDTGPKLGDAVYCINLKRWNLVDPD